MKASVRTLINYAVGLVLLVAGAATVSHADDDVTLNLKDVNIRSLVEIVAEATGKNFIIDARVKGNKVTVISSKPMNKNEVYQVFLSVLQVNGYAAVEVGNIIKIVPDVSAKQGPVSISSPGSPGIGDEMVTRVIAVQNVPAAQMVPILRPLIPQQGHLAAYTSSNMLIISDRAANIDRLVRIVQRIDKPDSQEIEVIPLQHASANEIVRIISTLAQKDAKGAQLPGAPLLVADDRTNSLLLSGDKASRLRIRGIIAHLDTPLEYSGKTQVIFLKYAKAEELAPLLLGISKTQQTAAQGGKPAVVANVSKGELDIQADPGNNALLVTAAPDEFERIKSVVRQLDIRRAQVLVETIIADVTTDLAAELGVQFALLDKDRAVGGTNFPFSSVPLANLIASPESVAGNIAGLVLGAGDNRDGRTNFAVLLNALQSDAATNILSTPTLVTMDNEEAEINVGREVPILTGSFTQTGDSSTNPFQTFDRKDVGILLRVTPQINEGNTLKLQIEQEASSLGANVEGAGFITNERSIKTSVLVEDDQILVLGGLIEDEFTDSVDKVPLLGDIPLLGRLFRSDASTKRKSNLMVFIHPVILRDRNSADYVTNRKYDYLRARQIESKMDRRGLLKTRGTNLPDLDELITQMPQPQPPELETGAVTPP